MAAEAKGCLQKQEELLKVACRSWKVLVSVGTGGILQRGLQEQAGLDKSVHRSKQDWSRVSEAV